MKLEITAESVAKSIRIIWKISHEANSHEKWLDAWGRVIERLNGIWAIINSSLRENREEGQELLNDINLLNSIAAENRFNWREK